MKFVYLMPENETLYGACRALLLPSLLCQVGSIWLTTGTEED
jgi:hypothetical protein